MGAVAVELLEGHLDVCVAEQAEKGDGHKVLASVKGVLTQVLRQAI
jgi:DNA-binding FrmR family transcriptional regulator